MIECVEVAGVLLLVFGRAVGWLGIVGVACAWDFPSVLECLQELGEFGDGGFYGWQRVGDLLVIMDGLVGVGDFFTGGGGDLRGDVDESLSGVGFAEAAGVTSGACGVCGSFECVAFYGDLLAGCEGEFDVRRRCARDFGQGDEPFAGEVCGALCAACGSNGALGFFRSGQELQVRQFGDVLLCASFGSIGFGDARSGVRFVVRIAGCLDEQFGNFVEGSEFDFGLGGCAGALQFLRGLHELCAQWQCGYRFSHG